MWQLARKQLMTTKTRLGAWIQVEILEKWYQSWVPQVYKRTEVTHYQHTQSKKIKQNF